MARATTPPSGGSRQSRRSRSGATGQGRSRPRALIVSDTRLLREAVMAALASDGQLEPVGAASAQDALSAVARQRPDLLLVDAAAATERGLLRAVKGVAAWTKMVVFGISQAEPDLLGWVVAGASGYVGRDGSLADLVEASESAMRGDVYCPPQFTALLLARLAGLSATRVAAAAHGTLTPREQQVMALLEQGLPNKEIARRLGIGHTTVKNHVHCILEKMHVRGRGEAAARHRQREDARMLPSATKPSSDHR